MASVFQLNQDADSGESSRKKRRKIELGIDCGREVSRTKWRSESEQQIYFKKLCDAVQQVRANCRSSSMYRKHRALRDAADRVLAVSARGRTRWSRAILTSRMNKNKHKKAIVKSTIENRMKKARDRARKLKVQLPHVEKRLCALSRLVPGCRKASFSNLIEETTDYIAALEMQVRAMTQLTELLVGSGGSPA